MSASPLSPAVPAAFPDREICVNCGRDSGASSFCHLYRGGRRLALCSPACVHSFLLAEPSPTGLAPAGNAATSSHPVWSLEAPPFPP